MPDVGLSWWLMDRIVRSLLTETMPSWNVSSEESFMFPVAVGERSARFTLIDPEGQQQALTVDPLGGDRYGLGLGGWTRRGTYKVKASRVGEAEEGEGTKLWEVPLAVNGPAEESQLAVQSLGKASSGQHSFIDASAQVMPLAKATSDDDDIWKMLVILVLGLLLAEMFFAAKSTTRLEPAR